MTKSKHVIIPYFLAIASTVLVTAVFLPVREPLGNSATVALVYILAVVLIVIRWGLGPSMATAMSGMITFNYFFLQPCYTFTISGYDGVMLYLSFIAISLIVGKLSAHAKGRADTAEKQLEEIGGLYSELQREIGERMHAEETLLESESKFRSLSEESLVGIYIIQDSRFRYLNPKMVEIFGYEVAELVDKLDPRDLVLAEDWPKVRDNLQRRLSDEQRSIHYEFRGVMNNAVFFLQTMLDDADETTKEYLGIIKKEIDTSLGIITDLLDFARTKSPRTGVVPVRELIDQGLGRCAIPETVELRDEVPQTLPPLKIDPLQIGQVLQNLIMNGVQAMPAGGVLTLRGRQDDEGLVRLEVADTGEGISSANMKKLFQPLFTTKPKGIGLGLVVCRNLTEAGGGRIEVESEQGKGAIFTMVLPA